MTELVKARAAIDINTFMLSGASKVRPYIGVYFQSQNVSQNL